MYYDGSSDDDEEQNGEDKMNKAGRRYLAQTKIFHATQGAQKQKGDNSQ